MRSITDELADITIGDPAHFGSLTVFPLFRGAPIQDPGYVLLDDAIAQGAARVTELHGGSVPELQFDNCGEKPVLVLDGEELTGAKQNRTVNLTILAPANQAIVIPVSCVEAGRWHMQSDEFRPAGHVMYALARASRAAQVTASMASSGTRRSDQAAVWEEIAAKSQRLGTPSPTQAMSAMYEDRTVPIEAYLRAFAWTEKQSGVLFAIGSNTLGLDLLDAPDAMRKLLPKLLRSYALDAIEALRSEPAGKETAVDFLARLADSRAMSEPAVGLGKDVRLTADGVSGAALWYHNRYVHICGFTTANGHPVPGSRMARPTRRRAR
jgi:hypothetical protein